MIDTRSQHSALRDGGQAGTRAPQAGALPADPPAEAARPRSRSGWRPEAALACLLAGAAALLTLTGNPGSEFWWNDAPRHAMDGVFLLDAVRDLPDSLNIVEYTKEYYARYPCLGLVHYPPFFPAVEAVFFGLFGVSMATARATVAVFAAVGALFGYLVARRFLGRWGAALFVLLFIASPGVVYWSRDVMLDVPMLAMMLAGSYFFLRYVDDGRRGFGVAAALVFALAVLTKQNAGCMAPVWAGYAWWRRGWRFAFRKESLAGLGVAALLLVPYALATLRFAPLNVGQSVGHFSGEFHHSRASLASLGFYPGRLPFYATITCLAGVGILGIALVAGGRLRRRALGSPERVRGLVFASLWVVSCYVLFTFVIAIKEWRHILAWSPGLALLGASGFSVLAAGGRLARLALGAVTGVAGVQVALCAAGVQHDLAAPRAPFVGGTLAAARRLAAEPPGTVVFYAGNFNGNFIFNLRCLDPGRKVVVLRASKLLFSMPAMQEHGLTVHASTSDGILKILRAYGVRFLLVEDSTPTLDRVGPVMDEMRSLARSDLFLRRADYPIRSSAAYLACNVTLYEFRDPQPARVRTLEIDIPLGGCKIYVPLSRLGVQTSATAEDGSEEH